METDNEPISNMSEEKNLNADQNKTEEVKLFFKKDLLRMVKLFIKEPISGTYSLLENKGSNFYFQSIVLILTTAILYIFVPYLLIGSSRRYIEFSSMIKVGFIPSLFIFVIATISYLTKSISGKPDFKSELFTGALNSFPLSFLLIVMAFLTLFTDFGIHELMNPFQALNAGFFLIIILLYLFLMMINILQQSLKSSNTNDAVAYYISPAGVLLAFYITFQISTKLIF